MMLLKTSPLLTPLLLLAAALPCQAGSSRGSSVSDSANASIGGSSDSFESSSRNSSDSLPRRSVVPQGNYAIIDMVPVVQRPGMVRLTLRAVGGPAPAAEFALVLPAPTAGQNGLAAGQVITARDRPYGVEFLKADAAAQPFYLVLNDDWYRELKSNPVVL